MRYMASTPVWGLSSQPHCLPRPQGKLPAPLYLGLLAVHVELRCAAKGKLGIKSFAADVGTAARGNKDSVDVHAPVVLYRLHGRSQSNAMRGKQPGTLRFASLAW